jgi:hypothetical protein
VTADRNGVGKLLSVDRQGDFGGFFIHSAILALAAAQGKMQGQQSPPIAGLCPFDGLENRHELDAQPLAGSIGMKPFVPQQLDLDLQQLDRVAQLFKLRLGA